MKFFKHFYALAAFAAVLNCSQTAAGASFTNGSFESTTLANNGAAGSLSAAGDTRVSGWQYSNPGGANAFHLGPNSFGVSAFDGDKWILFGGSGTTGDRLQQTFDTVIGNSYNVTFRTTITQFTGTGAPPAQSVAISFLDSVLNVLPGGGTQNILSQTNGVWLLSNVFSFTATTSTSTLRFTDTSNGGVAFGLNYGLDDVRIAEVAGPGGSAVPEPSTLVLAASAALVLGWSRKCGRARRQEQ